MKATDCIHRQRCAALICCCYYLQAACASNQIYIYFQRELTENTSRSKIWLGIMLVYANFLRSIIMRVSYLVLFNACNDKIPSGNSIINVITGSFLNKTNFQPTLNFAISVYEELRFFVNIIYKQQHLSRRLTTIGEMKINWKKWSVRLKYTKHPYSRFHIIYP